MLLLFDDYNPFWGELMQLIFWISVLGNAFLLVLVVWGGEPSNYDEKSLVTTYGKNFFLGKTGAQRLAQLKLELIHGDYNNTDLKNFLEESLSELQGVLDKEQKLRDELKEKRRKRNAEKAKELQNYVFAEEVLTEKDKKAANGYTYKTKPELAQG